MGIPRCRSAAVLSRSSGGGGRTLKFIQSFRAIGRCCPESFRGAPVSLITAGEFHFFAFVGRAGADDGDDGDEGVNVPHVAHFAEGDHGGAFDVMDSAGLAGGDEGPDLRIVPRTLGRWKIRNPKSEIRNKPEIRRSKSEGSPSFEIRNARGFFGICWAANLRYSRILANGQRLWAGTSGFGLRASSRFAGFRISDFELRSSPSRRASPPARPGQGCPS